MGVGNLLGGTAGARVAALRGARFVRVFFIVVVRVHRPHRGRRRGRLVTRFAT